MHMQKNSLNFQELIFPAMLLQRRLDPLHKRQYALFLQPLPNDLDGYRESVHPIRIVMLVRAFGHAVQIPEPKRGRGQSIQRTVNMSYRENPAAVVEL